MPLFVPSKSAAKAVKSHNRSIEGILVDLIDRGVRVADRGESNSSTSVRLIVKFSVVKLPSALVARMVMLWEVAASKLSSVPSATLTTPVELLIAKRRRRYCPASR